MKGRRKAGSGEAAKSRRKAVTKAQRVAVERPTRVPLTARVDPAAAVGLAGGGRWLPHRPSTTAKGSRSKSWVQWKRKAKEVP